MANSSTTTTSKRTRKPVNLSTAQTANGALPSSTAIYDICGISTSHYKARTISDYSKDLNSLNLIELQDEAYKAGVIPSKDRSILIDRLERKFLQSNAKIPGSAQSFGGGGTINKNIHEKALAALARGR